MSQKDIGKTQLFGSESSQVPNYSNDDVDPNVNMDDEGAFQDYLRQQTGGEDDTPIASLAYQEFDDQGRKFKVLTPHALRY